MADEAWLDGDILLLKRKGQSVRVPLLDVRAVQAEMIPGIVSLTLSEPCALGERVRFVAPPKMRRAIIDEVKQRIARADTQHV